MTIAVICPVAGVGHAITFRDALCIVGAGVVGQYEVVALGEVEGRA